MTTVKYSLDEFVSDMESLLRDQPDYQQIFDIGTSWLEKLLHNPEAIPGAFRLPVGRGRRPNHGSYRQAHWTHIFTLLPPDVGEGWDGGRTLALASSLSLHPHVCMQQTSRVNDVEGNKVWGRSIASNNPRL